MEAGTFLSSAWRIGDGMEIGKKKAAELAGLST